MSRLAVGVFGVPGVGKSTLLTAHIARNPRDRHIVGSSIVKQVIAPHSVRDLDTWSADRQAAVRAEAIRRLEVERAATDGILLVDGHFTLRRRDTGRLHCVVTPEDRGFYGALVLLDGTPERVFAQCESDPRRRHGSSLAQVTEHLAAEREQAERTRLEMGVPVLTLRSADLTSRVSELGRFLSALAEVSEC